MIKYSTLNKSGLKGFKMIQMTKQEIDFRIKSQSPEYSTARYAVFYKLWFHCKLRLREISEQSGFDHSTVSYGIRRFGELMAVEDPLAVKYWNKLKNI